MSAVVSAVSNVVESAVNVVSDVVESVGDVVEDTVEVVKDAGSWVDDNVLQPLKEDPITTIATIAAVATGQAHLVPYINATSTVAKGGDIGDVALSFAASYAGNQAGQYVGKAVGESLSTVVTDAAGNVTYVPTVTSNLASSTAAGATRGAVSTGLQGGDIEQGLLTGAATGFAGGAGREAGQLVFDETQSKLMADIAAGATSGATSAALTDKDVGVGAFMGATGAALNNAVQFGSEYLFGEKKDQEDWQKAVTSVVGNQFKTAGMQEAYEFIADPQQRTQTAMRTGTQTGTGTAEDGTTQLAKKPTDFELVRYINDNGEVIYITFRNGEPQQQIPPGFREDKGTPTTVKPQPTQIVTAPAQQPKETNLGVTPLPPVGIAPPSSTVARSGSDINMNAAKGGLAVKPKKEKKPVTRKGLAAKKK